MNVATQTQRHSVEGWCIFVRLQRIWNCSRTDSGCPIQAICWLEWEDQMVVPNPPTTHDQRYKCRGHAETGNFRRIEARVHSVRPISQKHEISSHDHFSVSGPKKQHKRQSHRYPFPIPENTPTRRSIDRQQQRRKQGTHPDPGKQQVPRHFNFAVEVQRRGRLHQHHRHRHHQPLQPGTRTNRPRLPLTLAKHPRLSRSQQHLPILAVRRLRIAKRPHRNPVRILGGIPPAIAASCADS